MDFICCGGCGFGLFRSRDERSKSSKSNKKKGTNKKSTKSRKSRKETTTKGSLPAPAQGSNSEESGSTDLTIILFEEIELVFDGEDMRSNIYLSRFEGGL